MLLKEVVLDINPRIQKRKDADEQIELYKRSAERIKKLQARRKDKKPTSDEIKKSADEIGMLRRSKLTQADQFRDVSRQLRNKIRN